MEFLEGYLDGNVLDFFDALNLDALDYDSDQYWYSGSEDFYGSDSLDSSDWDNSERLDSVGLKLLGSILNDHFTSWKRRQFDADNDYFPVTFEGDGEKTGEPPKVFPSLMDLSCQVVSRHLPYSYIQRMQAHIPDLVAKKIMLYSFPRHVSDIYRYWLNPLIVHKGSNPELKDGCHVERIDQFGFCVQGQVTFLDETHTASLICDRCTITTVSCSCKKDGMLWCRHVVALAVCRINYASSIQIHLPVFDSISKLNREQLQKLLQYLTCDGHLPILKSLQDEVSRITLKQSLIEEIEDITAPTIYEGKPKWFLEPVYCRDISFPFFILLLRKALKMCKGKDINGMCVLKTLLCHIPSHHYASVGPMDKTITALISVISSPILTDEEKEECCTILKSKKSNHIASELYDETSNDPFESLWRNNINYISCKRTKLSSAAEKARKSVFYMPLASIDLSWKDKNLRRILSSDLTLAEVDLEGLCWFEHFPTSCARIEVLFNNGYEVEAIRLAVVIAKSVILQVKKWKIAWINALHDGSLPYTKSKVQQLMATAGESWLNQTMLLHKIDPVAILFSSLANASQILKHVCKDNPVIDENEYMQLAIEAIIVILSQQLFPKNKSNPDLLREYHQSEIIWLRSILSFVLPNNTADENEASVTTEWKPDANRIQDLFKLLAEAGPFTVFGSAGDYFIPRYQWGYMMISILYHIDRKLAVEAGWKCLKYPIEKIANSSSEDEYTSDHIKLVTNLLLSHDDDSKSTDQILDAADYLKNCCKAMHFLKESKAFILHQKSVLPEMSVFTKKMIIKRVLKALKSEAKTPLKNSGVCVLSLLRFAATIGYETVTEILMDWNELFDTSRNIEILQQCDWAENIIDSHNKSQTQLINMVYNLTLQCIAGDIVDDCVKFSALLKVQKTFQFNETQKKVLSDKTFKLGITLPIVATTQEVLFTTLSRLADDDVKRACFKDFVSEAIKKHKVSPQQLFLYSREEQVENRNSAFSLGILAVQNILILPNCKYGGMKVNFEMNCIVDVFRLAIDLGEREVTEVLSLVINRVKHDAVLCDLTKSFHAASVERNAVKPEWLETFIVDVMAILQQSLIRRSKRLRNGDVKNFINTLKRTKTIYFLANDGSSHFQSLLFCLQPLLPRAKKNMILHSVGYIAQ